MIIDRRYSCTEGSSHWETMEMKGLNYFWGAEMNFDGSGNDTSIYAIVRDIWVFISLSLSCEQVTKINMYNSQFVINSLRAITIACSQMQLFK